MSGFKKLSRIAPASAGRLPENFMLLHQGQEFIRSKSIEAIKAHDALPDHFEVAEQAMNLFDHFSRAYANEDEDQLVIQLLGIRLFNGTAAAIQLMLSGYYQAAVLQLRDLLEVGFLLDYFQLDRSQIAVWKTCDEAQRIKLFSPAKIRIALDDRDGFFEKKREQHYKLLCSLGGHATMQGFRMVRPTGDGLAHCGPFFAE